MTPQRFNILLVEDSAAEARLFETVLREVAPLVSCYWVATAGEAVEALRGADRFKDILGIDIVITDLHMPATDGWELIERIRSDPPTRTKPILVLSTSRYPVDIEKCYRLGATSYMVKPVTIDGMYEIVRMIARYWLELVQLPDSSA